MVKYLESYVLADFSALWALEGYVLAPTVPILTLWGFGGTAVYVIWALEFTSCARHDPLYCESFFSLHGPFYIRLTVYNLGSQADRDKKRTVISAGGTPTLWLLAVTTSCHSPSLLRGSAPLEMLSA